MKIELLLFAPPFSFIVDNENEKRLLLTAPRLLLAPSGIHVNNESTNTSILVSSGKL